MDPNKWTLPKTHKRATLQKRYSPAYHTITRRMDVWEGTGGQV